MQPDSFSLSTGLHMVLVGLHSRMDLNPDRDGIPSEIILKSIDINP